MIRLSAAKRTIFKYEVFDDETDIIAPIEKILDVQIQNGKTFIWALINDEFESKVHRITVYGTGWPIDEDPGEYIGTVQEGPYVWHYFYTIVEQLENDK